MNRIEYKAVLDAFPGTDVINGSDCYWNGVKIQHCGNFYVTVEGKLPYTMIERLRTEHPNEEFCNTCDYIACDADEIREEDEIGPTDDEYDKAIADIVKEEKPFEEFIKKCRLKEEEFLRRPDSNKYYSVISVTTTKALISLLSAIENEYRCRKESSEQEILGNTIMNVLCQVDPTISGRGLLDACYQYPMDSEPIVSSLEEFDKSVNPYISDNEVLLDPIHYLEEVSVAANKSASADGAIVEFTTNGTSNHAAYHRRTETFTISYVLESVDEYQGYLVVDHTFATKKPYAEKVKISRYTTDETKSTELVYDLLNGYISHNGEVMHPSASIDRVVVKSLIDEAAGYAKKITDSMKATALAKKKN